MPMTTSRALAAAALLGAAGITLRDVAEGYGNASNDSIARAVAQVLRDPKAFLPDEVPAEWSDAVDKYEAACVAELVSGSSPTNGGRRGRAAMERVRIAIEAVLAVERPCTVRQIYYQLVSRGVIDKTESEYKATVCRLLAEMRREGRIPYDAIADNTRWMRKPRSYASLGDALSQMQDDYRRAIWNDQDAYVEIWLEKDALAGVLVDVTRRWDVPLMVSRGFASLSFLHSAAEAIVEAGKPAHLYYFGDHDPSGIVIPQKIEQTLRELAPNAEIHFERVAVLPEQIDAWSLPTRPTKRTDSRSKDFVGESVEVDAIPPSKLRELCNACIARHVDETALEATRRTEQAERDTLDQLIRGGLAA